MNPPRCPNCTARARLFGHHGGLRHYRCPNCHWTQTKSERTKEGKK